MYFTTITSTLTPSNLQQAGTTYPQSHQHFLQKVCGTVCEKYNIYYMT